MKVVLALLAVAITALAQAPAPCVSPDNWSAHAVFFDSDRHEEIRSHFYYDATNERIRINELELQPGQGPTVFERLILHKEQKEYVYNPRTKKCTTESVTSPFKPIGVPEGAKYLDPLWIGLEPSATIGLSVDLWEVPIEDRPGESYIAGFTTKGCIPVTDAMMIRKGDIIDEHRISFYNVTSPIMDPDTIFKIPEGCEQ